MKKSIFLLLFLICSSLFAHNVNYENVNLHHWFVERENKTIEGTFYMFKDGNVYIEDADDNIINYPISYLSKEDQSFALKKYEWVRQVNNTSVAERNKPAEKQPVFNFRFWIAALLIVLPGLFLLSFTKKKKKKYLIPVLSMGVIIVLFSFTTRVLRSMQSTTDPLFIDSAFFPFKPNVFTHWDSTYFYVESHGIPATHPMMKGITNWQQQVPIPQCYVGNNAWSIPLKPVIATTPVPVSPAHFTRGAIAVAVNGIAIFNPYTNTGADAYLTGQLDDWGGHCGRADDYHYHIAPMSLYGYTALTNPLAFALDGFAVYGTEEPDGSPMNPLDTNNGHFGVNGVYHYHGVPSAPYMIGNMVGEVTEDTTHQIVPQAAAYPVRPALTPLQGAVIAACQPNTAGNGYTLTYTLNSQTDSIVYNWTTNGVYTFNFYTPGLTTQTYNGFVPCANPVSVTELNNVENNVLIYPNPSTNGFNISLSKEIMEKDMQQISIYTIKGDLIYRTDQYKQEMNFNNLSQGIFKCTVHGNWICYARTCNTGHWKSIYVYRWPYCRTRNNYSN
jgi:hypothetical protein